MMTEERALMPFQDTLKLGEVLARSGFFGDTKEASQAVVKVLAGQELGFGPIASMTGIHIVQGKPALGANLIASQIKRYGNYDFQVVELTNEKCTIAISENGRERGSASFTIEEAKTAGLTNKQTWKAYPSDMLFARAISRAARRFCPDVLSGMPIYTPEELGAEVDESGDVIDVTPTPVKHETTPPEAPPPPQQQKAPSSGNGHRPLDAESIRATIRKKAGWQDGARPDSEPITEGQVGAVLGLMTDALGAMRSDLRDKARHDILEYLIGVNSTKGLTKREASAIIDWLKIDIDGEWTINAYAQAEVARIIEAVAIEQGQMAMKM